jgi:hypothetical protein
MTATFPTALPTYTNPSGTDTVDAVDHAAQHANANDDIEALAAKVGTGASTPAGGSILTGNGTGTSTWLAKGTAAQVLTMNAGATAPEWATAASTGVTVLNRKNTETQVVSSTAETTVYSYTVPGGTLGSTGFLRLTLGGDYFNNGGGASTFTGKVKYGGTVIGVCSVSCGADASQRYTFRLEGELAALNATNSQRSNFRQTMGVPSASPPTTGSSVRFDTVTVNSGLAIDSTADQALIFTVQHSVNSASTDFKAMYAILEKL